MVEDSKGKPKRVGRAKGVPNKLSGTAKENIIAVFTRLNGTAGMAKWARKHPTEFYRIYARLLPTEIEGAVNLPIKIVFRDPTVRPDGYGRKPVSRD